MTSARIAASIQSIEAEFRPAVKCKAGHILSIAEQIERFCTRCPSWQQRGFATYSQIERFCDECGTVTPVDIREGKMSA